MPGRTFSAAPEPKKTATPPPDSINLGKAAFAISKLAVTLASNISRNLSPESSYAAGPGEKDPGRMDKAVKFSHPERLFDKCARNLGLRGGAGHIGDPNP